MEPQFEDRPAFRVMGVLARGKAEDIDFEALWMDRFMAHHGLVHPLSTDKAYYGVGVETGEPGEIEYVAGMAVDEAAEAAEGLVVREVAAARDAVFECTVRTVPQAWEGIFSAWLPGSGYEYDASVASFERYPPGTSAGDSPVFIHVPVRKADSG